MDIATRCNYGSVTSEATGRHLMHIELEKRALDAITPYAQNSKHHGEEDVALIMASIERFGFNDPIAVDEDGVIIEGHGRYEAATNLSLEHVPVIVLSGLTDEQKRMYRIAHNKIALSSTFDFAKLAEALGQIAGDDITYNHLGFSDAVADNLVNVVFGDGSLKEPSLSSVEPFDVIWDTKEQRDRWQGFMKRVHANFPNMSDAEALIEFIEESGILSGIRNLSNEVEEVTHEQ
jgi:hypothetical protein